MNERETEGTAGYYRQGRGYPMRLGRLTVICGSMFSGKSTELLRQLRRYELAGKAVAYFKPVVDDRYAQAEIVTHDQERVRAHTIYSPLEILHLLTAMPLDRPLPRAVGIDEGQFLDEADLIDVVDRLLRARIDVFVAGLDMTRHGIPFGPMPRLMAMAETVIKHRAVCAECGEDAYVSYNFAETHGDTVLVGGADKYRPLCRTCWTRQREAAGYDRLGPGLDSQSLP